MARITMEQVERVTYRQWDSYARRVFNKRIKEHGHSLAEAAIQRRAHPFIIEIETDIKVLLMRPGWREAMTAGGA